MKGVVINFVSIYSYQGKMNMLNEDLDFEVISFRKNKKDISLIWQMET